MARLNTDELRRVWADYMSDASARREPITVTKDVLLAEMEKIDTAADKGDTATSDVLLQKELGKVVDSLHKVRTGWQPPPDPVVLDEADLRARGR